MTASPIKTAIRSLKSGEPKTLYLLQGDDYFLQQFFLKQLEQAVFGEQPAERHLLLPDEIGGREILDQLRASDLFASRKLFVVRNAQQIKEPYREQFLDFCRNPLPNHFVVIIDEGFGRRPALIRELNKLVEPINTSKPFESEIRKWIGYFFSEKGYQTTAEIRDAVLTIAGDSVYHAANEVDKICLGLEPGQEIKLEQVKQFSGWRREHRLWEFMLAVGNRELEKAQQFGTALLVQGASLLSLVYQLTNLFQEILFLNISPGTSHGPSGFIPLSPAIKKRLGSFSRKYSRDESESALRKLGEIDQRIKSSTVSDDSELTAFIFGVVAGG